MAVFAFKCKVRLLQQPLLQTRWDCTGGWPLDMRHGLSLAMRSSFGLQNHTRSERERERALCVCDMKVDGILAYACPEQHQTRISYICLCDSFGTPRAISHHRME